MVSNQLFIYEITIKMLNIERDRSEKTVHPDQTVPLGAVLSGSTLFSTPSASFRHISALLTLLHSE